MELQPILLPRQRIVSASLFRETIRTLAIVGYQAILIATGADDDAVIGTESVWYLHLWLRSDENIFRSIVVIARRLQMPPAIHQAGLYLAEMPGVVKNGRQLARQRMLRRIKDEIAAVVTGDVVLCITGGKQNDK